MVSRKSADSPNPPWFWIIAGPNGVGKSTWAISKESVEIFGEIPVLNPDHFTEPYTSSPVSLVTAGRRIFREIKSLVSAHQSFAVETTLSGSQYFRLGKNLKQRGWKIGAVFIGVEGEDACIGRVEERRLGGGHDVPVADIIRRYHRSYQHIPQLLDLSEYMIILDNSYTYQQVLEKHKEEILIKEHPPAWLRTTLGI